MTIPNKYESYMLRLINADRKEAGLSPLKFDYDLNTSSDRHSQWMLNADVFSHTGSGGSTATERMQAAGYDLEGSWATGENIALRSKGGAAGLWDEVRAMHESLMNSPGHRANLMSSKYDEIGIGLKIGEFTSNGSDFDAVVITQNFGRTSADDVRAPAADAFEFKTSALADQGNAWDMFG
jgi:serralysin